MSAQAYDQHLQLVQGGVCSDSSDDEEKFGDIKEKLGGDGGGGLFGSDDDCSSDDDLFPGQGDACPPPQQQACPPPAAPADPVCPPKPCANQLVGQQQPVPIGAAVPQAEAAGAKSAKKSKEVEKKVTNTYLVQLQTSFAELAEKPDLAQWMVDKDAHWIFKKEKVQGELRNKNFKEERHGNLEKSVIQKATIKSIECGAPRALLMDIPHIRRNAFTGAGKNYGFKIGAGHSVPACDIVIYQSDKVLEGKHMKKWGHVTKESLEATYVENLDRAHYNVEAGPPKNRTPIIHVMYLNDRWKPLLDKGVFVQDGIDQVKLPKDVVETVRDHILGMLDRLPHVDMSEFSVVFSRADGEAWDSPAKILTFSGSDEEVQAELNRKFDLEVELEVEHVLTTLEAKPSKSLPSSK